MFFHQIEETWSARPKLAMRGDSRNETKEALGVREREGTSFPCRSHPNAPQAKPVSLGSIKSTGGVESGSGTIQRFVVKTRRIRRVAPKDPNLLDPSDGELAEVDTTSNEDELEQSKKMSALLSDEDCQGAVDTGPDSGDDSSSADVNHNKRHSSSGGGSSGCAHRGRGAAGGEQQHSTYDWFDECEREEQQRDWEEVNGIDDDADPPWSEDVFVQDMSDGDKLMSSIRKCAKMTRGHDKLCGRTTSSEVGSSSSVGRENYGSYDHVDAEDAYFCTKGATCSESKGDESTQARFERSKAVPHTEAKVRTSSGEYTSVSIQSKTERSAEPVLLTEREEKHQQQHRTRSHDVIKQPGPCVDDRTENTGLDTSRKSSRRQGCDSHGDHVITAARTKLSGTPMNDTPEKSGVCDHTEELDSDSDVGSDKIRQGAKEFTDSPCDQSEVDVCVETSDHQARRRHVGRRERERANSERSARLQEQEAPTKEGDDEEQSEESESEDASSAAAYSLPKTVTFAKSVKPVDAEAEDDDDTGEMNNESDEDTDEFEDSQEELILSRKPPSGGDGRTKRVVSVGKHHTIIADLDESDVSALGGRPHRLAPPLATFHYVGVPPPTFSRHLHPPGGSAVGSASGKRQFLTLPLGEQDSSEVDSCSSTDISPGDSSSVATPVAGVSSSAAAPLGYSTRLLSPGEVYYFAPNSCVVCVERSKLAPTKIQVSTVLREGVPVFVLC